MKTYRLAYEKVKHHSQKPVEYYIDENGCHICTSHKAGNSGYPQKRFNGKNIRLHRYVFILANEKELNSKDYICHSCDNRMCINPNHLFLGTHQDNMRDMLSKDRQVKHSKLTKEQIYEIKINTLDTMKSLSEKYSVSASTIRDIWNEKTHKNVKIDNYKDIVKERVANRQLRDDRRGANRWGQ